MGILPAPSLGPLLVPALIGVVAAPFVFAILFAIGVFYQRLA